MASHRASAPWKADDDGCSRGADPVRLADIVPMLRCPGGRMTHTRRPEMYPVGPTVPENLSNLWQSDLLLGGAAVRRTPQIEAVLTGPPCTPTAWVSATLKYRARTVTAGAGLHLGVQTGSSAGRGTAVQLQRTRFRGPPQIASTRRAQAVPCGTQRGRVV